MHINEYIAQVLHTNASIILYITLHRCCSPRPLHGVHMCHTKGLYHACIIMHSAVARHIDVYMCVND